jgi:hypothetical protein
MLAIEIEFMPFYPQTVSSTITDTDRLDFVLMLLNAGGTSSLACISPEVCSEWGRDLIDLQIQEVKNKEVRQRQKKLNDLLVERERIEKEVRELS